MLGSKEREQGCKQSIGIIISSTKNWKQVVVRDAINSTTDVDLGVIIYVCCHWQLSVSSPNNLIVARLVKENS